MSTESDPESPKMLWIHCLVGIKSFRQGSRLYEEVSYNALFHNSKKNGKVIQNPHLDPDHIKT